MAAAGGFPGPERRPMTHARGFRVAFHVLAAAALLSALYVLYHQTQAGPYKAAPEVLARLRELRDMDARWDADVLRFTGEPLRVARAGVDRATLMNHLLRDIEQGRGGALAADDLAAIRDRVTEKSQAYDGLRKGRERTLAALAALQRRAATARVAPGELEAAVHGLLEANASEVAALQRFSFLTLGSRIDLAQRTLAGALQQALDETDRWRVYLAAYAAALLVGVGWLATRVAQAQAALRAANEGLEQRVAERTRELTEALAKLRESEAQLVQSEKMSSLGQLVAGVVHEINTPLAYVKNGVATVRDHLDELEGAIAQSGRLLELLRHDAPDPHLLQEAFAGLELRLAAIAEHEVMGDLESLTRDGLHGIERISELTHNLRNFARLDRSKVSACDLNESVRSTFTIARSMLSGLEVEKRLGEIPPITCSPSQINQVLLNLVTNAAQAIEKPPGRVVVTTRREGGGHVAVEVEDNGPGIAPDVMPRIFDPFFTTKDVGKGTGLGLSIAYKIVAEHGGRIDVRSAPGEGARFTVVLPIEPPAVPPGHRNAEAHA